MSRIQSLPLMLGFVMLAGCDGSAAPSAPLDVQITDAVPKDAMALDATSSDAVVMDAMMDAMNADSRVPDAMDAMIRDLGADAAPLDGGRLGDAAVDHGAVDATPADAAVDAIRCVAEACNAVDDDCDGLIDEGEACVPALLAGCRVHLALRDADGREAATDSGGDAVFHGFGPPDDVDAGDTLFFAWRCAAPVRWAQQRCVISVAHAGGSDADPLNCDVSPCVQTRGDGARVGLEFTADVDGNSRFAVGFECADPDFPVRAAAVQSRLRVWLATQHRRAADDGLCLDEPRHERVPQWGFCPGEEMDDEGRHRCVSSAGDGALHQFPVGTPGGVWPDLGPCDTFGVALTR